jgi:hypothetical protein
MTTTFPVSLREYDRLKRENDFIEREENMTEQTKTVNLDLTECNGNAFALIGAFRRQARREKWTDEEIEAVTTECQPGDYDHLLQTLIPICKPILGDDE